MWPSADALPLTAPQGNALRRLVRGRNTRQKMVLRAHIVLRCAQGLANHAIARGLGVNRKTVIPVAKALRPVRPRRTPRSDAPRTQTGALR